MFSRIVLTSVFISYLCFKRVKTKIGGADEILSFRGLLLHGQVRLAVFTDLSDRFLPEGKGGRFS